MREPLNLKPTKRPYQKRNKGGRPTKFDPKYVIEAERLATIGVSIEDMAGYWGLHRDTVFEWRKRYPTFSDALEKGNAKKKTALYQALFKNAVEGRNVAAQIFLAKNWLGMSDRQEIQHSGDVQFDGKLVIEVVKTK